MTLEKEANFVHQPLSVLTSSASSRRSAEMLSSSVSQLAATGPDALDALQVAIVKATALQNRAIGRGLYQMVLYCQGISPEASARVQKMVDSLGNKDVTNSFNISKSVAEVENAAATTSSANAVGTGAISGALVGQPTLNNPGSLTLSDPFGSPDDWK